MWSGSSLTKINEPKAKPKKIKKAKAVITASAKNTLNSLRDICVAESKAKGWRTEPKINVGDFMSNLHGEVSELWEAYRESKLDKLCNKSEKMIENGIEPLTCAEEELADIVIRALDTSEALGVDIGKAVNAKLQYNRTREHRNGGKLA